MPVAGKGAAITDFRESNYKKKLSAAAREGPALPGWAPGPSWLADAALSATQIRGTGRRTAKN